MPIPDSLGAFHRRRIRPVLLLHVVVGLWTLTVAPAAHALPSALCERAAQRAAAITGVPLPVLRAIALTETGRTRAGRTEAWPWTTNAVGEGHWFEDRATAEAHVRALRSNGIESVDIGCFQINLRWHGEAFSSPEAMFEPEANALYAAQFLSELHAEFGSWQAAAGAYHSRTPELAQRYTRRFLAYLSDLDPTMPLSASLDEGRPQRRRATFGAAGPLVRADASPLVTTAAAATAGSLMPGAVGRGSLLVTGVGLLR